MERLRAGKGGGMDDDLRRAAEAARKHAHAPYSAYPVGAALRTRDGAVYAGCNVENASFPEGWCAETSAIAAMVAGGQVGDGRRIVAVCVIADKIDGRIVTPCGGCRQRLAEFGDPDTIVFSVAPDGDSSTFRLDELLPAAFEMDHAR